MAVTVEPEGFKRRQFSVRGALHQLPRNVIACGALPKNTAPWRRLITDYRPSNVFVDPWLERYISIRGLSLLPEPNTLYWSWVLNKVRNGYVARWSKRYGCGLGDCLNFCEKSLGSACIGPRVMLPGGCQCQFGAKTGNGQ